MQVDPVQNANSLECIRCGKCKNICPTGAISCGFRTKEECLEANKQMTAQVEK